MEFIVNYRTLFLIYHFFFRFVAIHLKLSPTNCVSHLPIFNWINFWPNLLQSLWRQFTIIAFPKWHTTHVSDVKWQVLLFACNGAIVVCKMSPNENPYQLNNNLMSLVFCVLFTQYVFLVCSCWILVIVNHSKQHCTPAQTYRHTDTQPLWRTMKIISIKWQLNKGQQQQQCVLKQNSRSWI